MSQFTKQILFNTVCIGLASQNWQQSMNEETDDCLYRHPDGKKCVIGWLISDSLYKPEMERHHLYTLQTQFSLFHPSLTDFLGRMQAVHDNSMNQLRSDFRKFGRKEGLEVPKWV
jgi:hypothetical protein